MRTTEEAGEGRGKRGVKGRGRRCSDEVGFGGGLRRDVRSDVARAVIYIESNRMVTLPKSIWSNYLSYPRHCFFLILRPSILYPLAGVVLKPHKEH